MEPFGKWNRKTSTVNANSVESREGLMGDFSPVNGMKQGTLLSPVCSLFCINVNDRPMLLLCTMESWFWLFYSPPFRWRFK